MKKLILTSILLFTLTASYSVPIETAGNYKGWKYNVQGGVTIKCGWQWWHTCFGISGGYIWVDDWDHIIGTVRIQNPEEGGDPLIPTNEQILQNMSSGSVMGEDGSMETWYQFTEPLIFNMNE